MNNKELKAYYKTHQPTPNFLQYDTLGHAVFYAHAGAKELPLLLFIHGAPGRWYGYIDYLSDSTLLKNFQMISIDRAGYGNSAKGGAVTSIAQQALLWPNCFVFGSIKQSKSKSTFAYFKRC